MKLLKIIIFVILFGFFTNTFALSATSNIYLDMASENKLEIHWDKVDLAEVYGVSYGKTSGIDNGYEHELEILTGEEAKATIDNLDNNSKYYIAIKSYDSDNNESEYSNEVSFSTTDKLSELKNKTIKIIDTRNVEMDFNVDLKKDYLVDVVINNKDDDLENIGVEKYTIDGSKLSLFLDNDLKLLNKYAITIISLEGSKGEKINAGVDGIVEFEVAKDVKKYTEKSEDDLDLQSADIANNNDTGNNNEDININNEEIQSNNNKVLGGSDIKSDIKNNSDNKIVESVAKKNNKLPQTGPAETLLILIFSFIAGLLFLNLRKKIR